ncbi:MAG: hypothetical protein C0614_00845 [Desulfuromonas sp.]|nr:MAG: hypothetical protein C0614_00845 [Desulfuromonas sp.]
MRLRSCLLLLAVCLFMTGCLQAIPNDPRLIESFYQRPENVRIDYQTDKGRQVAYYLPPSRAPEAPPKYLAILFPGINAIALGWLPFIDLEENADTGYLLIDYPGRGDSEGMMRPEENYRNSEGALRALAQHFGLKRLPARLSLLGHSFGTGAALQFASRQPVESIVLVAPFNDLKRAVRQTSFLLAFLMPSQIDNRELLKEILGRSSPPRISILHGDRDQTLPVTMGADLAAVAPEQIDFYRFAEDGHVNILTRRRQLIFSSLNGWSP